MHEGKGVQQSRSIVGTLDQFLVRATSLLEHEIVLTERRLSMEPLANKRSSLGGLATFATPDRGSKIDRLSEVVLAAAPETVQEPPIELSPCESIPEVETNCTNYRATTRALGKIKPPSVGPTPDPVVKRKRGGGPQRHKPAKLARHSRKGGDDSSEHLNDQGIKTQNLAQTTITATSKASQASYLPMDEVSWQRLETLILTILDPLTMRLVQIENKINGLESLAKSNFRSTEAFLSKIGSSHTPNDNAVITEATHWKTSKRTLPVKPPALPLPIMSKPVFPSPPKNMEPVKITDEFDKSTDSLGEFAQTITSPLAAKISDNIAATNNPPMTTNDQEATGQALTSKGRGNPGAKMRTERQPQSPLRLGSRSTNLHLPPAAAPLVVVLGNVPRLRDGQVESTAQLMIKTLHWTDQKLRGAGCGT